MHLDDVRLPTWHYVLQVDCTVDIASQLEMISEVPSHFESGQANDEDFRSTVQKRGCGERVTYCCGSNDWNWPRLAVRKYSKMSSSTPRRLRGSVRVVSSLTMDHDLGDSRILPGVRYTRHSLGTSGSPGRTF